MFKQLTFLILITLISMVFIQCNNTVESTKEITENPVVSDKSTANTPPTEPKPKPTVTKLPSTPAPTPIVEKEAAAVKKVVAKNIESADRKKEPAPVKKVKKRAKIKFNETIHKFGNIKTGDKVNHKFKFKNTGNAPLVIKNVDVSCGCTFPSYPFLPIKPGAEGEIDVTFNSENKVGRQKPTVTVVTNGRPRTLKLYLEGFVE